MSEYSVMDLTLKQQELSQDMCGVLTEIVRMFGVLYDLRGIVFEALREQDVLGKSELFPVGVNHHVPATFYELTAKFLEEFP